MAAMAAVVGGPYHGDGEVSPVTGAAEAAEVEREEPVDSGEASVYLKEEVEGEQGVVEAATLSSKVVEDARVGETGMEAEKVDEEDPVETELVVDDEARDTEDEQGANAAHEDNEANGYPGEVENGDGHVDHLNDEGDIGGGESDDVESAKLDRRKNKEREIFIGGLPKDWVDEDIRKVFSEFGKIESIKIIKNPVTNSTKGFAFLCYGNTEDAMKALEKVSEETEVKGKKVRISASQDNSTLYLGNICKTWTKDQVESMLNELGIDGLEMSLPDDPDSGGRNKGFAFIQFESHSDAIEAFQRLRKPDAIFGMNRSAKVSFAQTPLQPCEDLLMKVKTIYLEHVPLSWDEEKIEECCKEHIEIKKIVLVRKLKRSKKKDISFVEFYSRDSALACVEGINSGWIGDGEVKIFASLARPLCKGRLAKQGTKGGYKVNSGMTTTSQPEKNAQEDKVIVNKKALYKLSNGNNSKHVSRGSIEVREPSLHYKGKGQARGNRHTLVSGRPTKKARKNFDVPIKSSRRDAHAGQSLIAHVIHPTGPQHASIYQDFSYACASKSNAQTYDLEPHAGYIADTNHTRSNYAYDQQRTASYTSQRTSVPDYVRGPLRPAYAAHANYTVFQPVYAYPPPNGPYPVLILARYGVR
ncbi:hypothetical protein ACP4OV_015499 [Aristida adscensionis]